MMKSRLRRGSGSNREIYELSELWPIVLQVCKKLTHCEQVVKLMNFQDVVGCCCFVLSFLVSCLVILLSIRKGSRDAILHKRAAPSYA